MATRKAKCHWCGKVVSLCKGGVMRSHTVLRPGIGKFPCHGSGDTATLDAIKDAQVHRPTTEREG